METINNIFVAVIMFLFVTSSCKDELGKDNVENLLEKTELVADYLKFTSKNDFKSYLNTFENMVEGNLNIRKLKGISSIINIPENFKSIAEISEKEILIQKSNKFSSNEDEIEEMTEDEYNLMMAKNLLLDPILYHVMDTTLRIGIEGNLYKITKYGTFFAPYDKENELTEVINNFEELQKTLPTTNGNK